MAYTKDDFQEWIFFISDKMDYFTEQFAEENNLTLDYSVESLDRLEQWIITRFNDSKDLISDKKLLDLIGIYIGETFRNHIGGKWHIDLENKQNVYYHMPVLTDKNYKGETNKAPLTYATASIHRKKGNYISTILKNNIENMSVKRVKND